MEATYMKLIKECFVTILKSLANKNDNNFVNESRLFLRVKL